MKSDSGEKQPEYTLEQLRAMARGNFLSAHASDYYGAVKQLFAVLTERDATSPAALGADEAARGNGLSPAEECAWVKAVVHGNCKGEIRHKDFTCDAFLCLPELRPEHHTLVSVTLTRNAFDAVLASVTTSAIHAAEQRVRGQAVQCAKDFYEMDSADFEAKYHATHDDELWEVLARLGEPERKQPSN